MKQEEPLPGEGGPAGYDAVVVRADTYGLCNRVQAVCAAQVIAAQNACPLYVQWVPDDHCPGDWREAFYPGYVFWNEADDATVARLRGACRKPLMFTHSYNAANPTRFAAWTGYGPERTAAEAYAWFRRLQPAFRVRDKLGAIFGGGLPPVCRVGVHVRRTDLVWRRARERDDALADRMREILLEEPNVVFVVAADNPGSVALLRRKFAERVVHTGAVWRRRGIRWTSLEDTAADLYALRSCSRLLGTAESTFSTAAAELGQIPLERL